MCECSLIFSLIYASHPGRRLKQIMTWISSLKLPRLTRSVFKGAPWQLLERHKRILNTMSRLTTASFLVFLSLLAILMMPAIAATQDSWPTCDLCRSGDGCGHNEENPTSPGLVVPKFSSGPSGSIWQYHYNNEIPISAIVQKSGTGCTFYVQHEPSPGLRDPSTGQVVPKNAQPYIWFYFENNEVTAFALDFIGISPDPEGTQRCKRFVPSCNPSELQGVTTFFL